MKVADLLNLSQTITELQATPAARKVKFGYMLSFNKKLIESVRESVVESLKDPDIDPKLEAFERDRIAALQEVADKDADGNPVIKDGQFVIQNVERVLPKIQSELVEKHPDVEALMNDKNKRIAEVMELDQDVKLRKLPLADWPDLPDTLSPEVMDQMMVMVEA